MHILPDYNLFMCAFKTEIIIWLVSYFKFDCGVCVCAVVSVSSLLI